MKLLGELGIYKHAKKKKKKSLTKTATLVLASLKLNCSLVFFIFDGIWPMGSAACAGICGSQQ